MDDYVKINATFLAGCVGRVIEHTKDNDIIINVGGNVCICLENWQIEPISKEEYFKEILRG